MTAKSEDRQHWNDTSAGFKKITLLRDVLYDSLCQAVVMLLVTCVQATMSTLMTWHGMAWHSLTYPKWWQPSAKGCAMFSVTCVQLKKPKTYKLWHDMVWHDNLKWWQPVLRACNVFSDVCTIEETKDMKWCDMTCNMTWHDMTYLKWWQPVLRVCNVFSGMCTIKETKHIWHDVTWHVPWHDVTWHVPWHDIP